MRTAPLDAAVDQRVPRFDRLAVIVLNDARADGQADVVEAAGRDAFDVSLRNEHVAELCPELGGALGTDESVDQRFDLARRLGSRSEFPHVALGQEPVADAHATQQQLAARAVDESRVVGADEPEKSAGRG